MTSLSALRAGLAARVDTIADLTVYAKVPGSVAVPAAVVRPGRETFLMYDQSMDGADDVTLVVQVLVSDADDPSAEDALDAYLADSGASSIKAAVDADPTLGGVAHFSAVTQARNYGLFDYGAIKYLGCELVVTIGAL